jgi:hypothetical protein
MMHLASGVVGKAEHYYDGVQHQFFSSSEGPPLTAPVLKLHQGHAFLCKDAATGEDAFVELSGDEASFYVLSLAALESAMLGMAEKHAHRIDARRGMMLFTAALAAQLNEMRKAGA